MSERFSSGNYSPELATGIDWLFGDCRRTDMQFNIGRVEGLKGRGADIIDPATKERIYVAVDSSLEAEEEIGRRIGNVVLERVDSIDLEEVGYDNTLNVYNVPSGARMLSKTFQQSPYHQKYMQGLARRTGDFVRSVYDVDHGLFGSDAYSVAIVPSEIDDNDIDFIITPPLVATEGKNADLHSIGVQIVSDQYLEHFLEGAELDQRESND